VTTKHKDAVILVSCKGDVLSASRWFIVTLAGFFFPADSLCRKG
jgi:hypothetical protein